MNLHLVVADEIERIKLLHIWPSLGSTICDTQAGGSMEGGIVGLASVPLKIARQKFVADALAHFGFRFP